MSKKNKVILFSSLLINIVGIVVALLLFVRIGGMDYFSDAEASFDENPYYIERMNLFEGNQIPVGSTIFIGDSITQRGLWEELFPGEIIINRGINSDTTEGVLNRLENIVASKPEKVFLMIGINDLYAQKTNDEIISNYEEILNQFTSESPETNVYVQSVLPLNYEMYFAGDKINNETVQELNGKLKTLTDTYKYKYVDLYTLFEEAGQLQSKYSYDGIHLNGEGYKVWREAIQLHLN